MKTPIIAPSLLAADFANLSSEINEIEKAGAEWLHVDVMDGSFVPPITFGANMCEVAKKHSDLFIDVHLMIDNPDKHIESFKDAGSDQIIVHQETSPHLHRTLGKIRSLGIKSGVAINPATPVSTIQHVLEICDLVLVMTVNPGWGGQSFIPSCVDKISELATLRSKSNYNFLIEVDGGVNDKTGKECASAGADVLVAGSYIFGSSNRKERIDSLKV